VSVLSTTNVERWSPSVCCSPAGLQTLAGLMAGCGGVVCLVQSPELVVGRVCCDSEGRINEQSVLLEGSIAFSEGARVRLDLSNLDAFQLFPGQVLRMPSWKAFADGRGRLLASLSRHLVFTQMHHHICRSVRSPHARDSRMLRYRLLVVIYGAAGCPKLHLSALVTGGRSEGTQPIRDLPGGHRAAHQHAAAHAEQHP
jgi:hypothetical protein